MRRLVTVIGMAAFLALILAGCTNIDCDFKKCVGTNGPDDMQGTDGDDYKLIALKDCDFVSGRAGNDKLFGDEGDDIVVGNPGNDKIFGGPGNDALGDNADGNTPDSRRTERVEEIEDCITRAEGGSESIAAYMQPGAILPSGDPVEVLGEGGGKDKFYGEGGNDEIQANEGNKDLVNCGPGRDTAFVDEGLDKVVDCEIVNPDPEQAGGA